ncbi:sensor domain-containing diguanylate cyclase [Belnapia rosea]|uniref:sensor domain-containing diguanylate cyclase n=1 Tax=Belnapia rosea TaxID=938405 RepID=UPI00088C267C|nr:diguanylate cyclase [Belnapia rosea]SDB71179.1 PAS domain S-box-containing protein/diguanylate cyclase (GGDEF) domain-containing protein [Belnapia rosea]
MRSIWKAMRNGWTAALSVLVILGFCALSIAVILQLRADRWAQATDAAMNLNRAVGQDIARTFSTLDLALLGVAERLHADQGAYREQILHTPVFERSATAQHLGAVMVLDSAGVVVSDTGPIQMRGTNLANREYYEVHRAGTVEGLHISRPFRGRTTGEWRLALSRRWDRQDGSFGGVVMASLKLDYIRGIFGSLDLGPGGRITLFREDGIVLLRSPQGEAMIDLDLSQGTAFRAIPTAAEGHYRSISGRDGVERFYVFKRIEGLPLILNLGTSIDAIEDGWRPRALVIGGTTLVLVGALLAALWRLRLELRRRRTAELLARRREADFRLLAENTGDMVSRIGPDGIRRYVSPAAYAILGRGPDQLLGTSALEGVHPEDLPALATEVARLRGRTAEAVTVTYRSWRADGAEIWLESTLKAVPGAVPGRLDGVVAVTRDITERKVLERQLANLARLDGLTGVANRRSFDEALGRAWAQCMQAGLPVSLILVDVDHFKAFNDHYGHQGGDGCLRVVAATVGATIRRAGDLVARYGGEEFVVLLPETDAEGAAAVAERLRMEVEALALPHAACGREDGVVTVSVGLATMRPASCRSARGPEALVEAADQALYQAKQAGRNRVMRAPQIDPLGPVAAL